MLNLATTLVLLVATCNAFAGRITIRSSWDEIEASLRHNVLKPTTLDAVGGIFNACLSEDEQSFETINDVRYCAQGHQEEVRLGDNVFWDWVCDRYETKPMKMSRTIVRRECIEYGNDFEQSFCRRYADKTQILPVDYLIEVQERAGGDEGYRTIFKKPYTIPSCN